MIAKSITENVRTFFDQTNFFPHLSGGPHLYLTKLNKAKSE